MRHYRLTCLFALHSVTLAAAMSSCSPSSDPAVIEPPPVRQAGLPPTRVEPAERDVPAEEHPQELPKAVIDAQKPPQLAEPEVDQQGVPKVAVDKDAPIVPPAQPKEVEPPVPMAEAADAATLPDVDYSLVHLAPTDVAVLVIRPAQILENLRIAEHIKQIELLGGTHPLKTMLNDWERTAKEQLEMPLPPIESVQISVTRECLDSLIAGGLVLNNLSFPTILIEFRQDVDHEALFMKLLQKMPAEVRDQNFVKQHGKTKMLVGSQNEGVPHAVCLLDSKTLLWGTESAVVRAVDRQGKPEASPLLDRIVPHLGKELSYISTDVGKEMLGNAKSAAYIGDLLYNFLAIGELFLDLNGDVVFNYRQHNDEDGLEDTLGDYAFEYTFTQITGDDLHSVGKGGILGRLGEILVPQQAIAPGYTVDRAAFDKQWIRMNKETPEWIVRNKNAARKAAELASEAKKRSLEAALPGKANSLNLIARAMRRYETRHKCFPAVDSAGLDKSPRGLSWRVHLLPELGQSKLYDQFHLDEPWDSDHNKTLIAKMPPIYGADPAGKSAIHVFIGDGAPFGGMQSLKLAEIKDSLVYTAAIIEAGPDKAEPWTKPGGLPWNRENSVVELGTIGLEVPVAFFDAGAGWFPATIPHETLSKMIGHSDGNPLRVDILKWRHVPPNRIEVKR